MTPPTNHGTAHRASLLRTLEPPRRSPNDVRLGVAILVVAAILAAASLVIAGARLADNIRSTRNDARLLMERCGR